MRGRGLVAVAAMAFPLLLGGPAQALTVPDGYVVEVREELAHGLEHLRLSRVGPAEVVHIARLAPDAAVELRAVLSNEEVAGDGARLERTSSMCARVRCLVAVNGDFAFPATGEPVGGLVADGQLLRSPSETHHQLAVSSDGKLSAGPLAWSGTLMPTDLRPMNIEGVNVDRQVDDLILYTGAHGSTTGTNGQGLEVVGKVIEPANALRLGQTALIELRHWRDGQPAAAIGDGEVVLSGHGEGAKALSDLRARINQGRAASRVLLRLDTSSAVAESVGGTPVLLRDGARWFGGATDDFTTGRHPRTLVGWDAAGEVLLVTVDGRQPGVSEGMSLEEAADFLLALGVRDAMNLDGGGSTTFVVDGQVVSSPSDVVVARDGEPVVVRTPGRGERIIGRAERPAVSGLAVVGRNPVDVPPTASSKGLDLGLPQTLALPAPAGLDPGSIPDAGLAVLLGEDETPGDLTVEPAGNRPGGSRFPAALACGLLSVVLLLAASIGGRGRGRGGRRGRGADVGRGERGGRIARELAAVGERRASAIESFGR